MTNEITHIESPNEPSLSKIIAEAAIISFEKLGKRSREKIKALWLKKEYGFTPLLDEGRRLKEISENPIYEAYKKCVGNNEFNPYIKVGLLLYELNCRGDKRRVDEIRKEIYSKKEERFRKIIHIASTGILINVLEYLINIKTENNLSSVVILEEFTKILDEWEKISIPVRNEDRTYHIKVQIRRILKNEPKMLFVYAAGRATLIAQKSVAELNNKMTFKNYIPWCKNHTILGIPHFIGIIYNVKNPTSPFES